MDTNSQALSIVIPVYNEEGNLKHLYQELTLMLTSQHLLDYEIIFIDDGSSDNSLHILRDIHLGDPHVKVIQLRRNFGQTSAFAAGFDYASGDIIVTIRFGWAK